MTIFPRQKFVNKELRRKRAKPSAAPGASASKSSASDGARRSIFTRTAARLIAESGEHAAVLLGVAVPMDKTGE